MSIGLDLINESNTSQLPSKGLTKDEVLDLINSNIPSSVPVNLSQDITAMRESLSSTNPIQEWEGFNVRIIEPRKG